AVGLLHLLIPGVLVAFEVVQQVGHEPAEALALPHAAQGQLGVFLQQVGAAFLVDLDQDAIQVADVGGGQVQALGAGRRDDVGSVAEQEQVAVLHRLDHEAAQRGDTLFQRRAGDQLVADFLRQARLEFVPEALVGPVFDLVAQRHLQVVAAAGQRALAAEHEAALVVGVDQFVVDRRGVGQQAEPAERVDALVFGQHALGNALAGHTVEAVATGDVITVDAVGLAVLLVSDVGLGTLEFVQLDVAGGVDDGRAAGSAGIHQVAGDFGLAVDHDGLATGQLLQVHRYALAVEYQLNAFV